MGERLTIRNAGGFLILPTNDGDTNELAGGPHNEALVGMIGAKYYELTRRGKVFNASTVVAGVAFPISTTTAPVFGIFNPSDSGVVCIPLLFRTSYVSGTAVQTGVGFNRVTAAGNMSQIATGQPIAAMTAVTPTNAYSGGAAGKVQGFSSITLTAAATWWMALGLNTFTGAATVPVGISSMPTVDFEGSVVIPPGTCIFTVGNAASSALYHQTLMYAELPLGAY